MSNFENELQQAANRVPITSTGVDTIVATAQRRTRRRRVAVAAGSAAAVVAVAVAGVTTLSDVNDADELEISADTNRDTPARPTAAAPQSPTIQPGSAAGATIEFPNLVDAQRIDPIMSWQVVPADSPETLSWRFDSTQQYAIATAESAAGQSVPALFAQNDGEWSQIAADFVPTNLRYTQVIGDQIYAIGTAPATAGAPEGSLGLYDVAAGEWNLQALPEAILPYNSERVREYNDLMMTPYDGGVIIASVTGGGALKYELIEPLVDSQDSDSFNFEWVDGELQLYTNCDESTATTMPSTVVPGSVVPGAPPPTQPPAEMCETDTMSAQELGLTAADIESLNQPAQLNLVRWQDGEFTPIASPAPNAQYAWLHDGFLITELNDGSQRAFEVTSDGSFVEVFGDLPVRLYGFNSLESTETGVYGSVNSVLSRWVDGATTSVDLTAVASEPGTQGVFVNQYAAGSVDGTLVSVLSRNYQPASTITEPTVLADSGYELRIDPEGSWTVVEQATGQDMLAYGNYQLSTAAGSVQLIERTMAPEVTTTTMIVTDASLPGSAQSGEVVANFAIDWRTVPGLNSVNDEVIMTTNDGVHVAVESLEDLLGPVGPTERWLLGEINEVDGQVTIRATRYDTVTEAPAAKPVILVGTPKT